MNYTTSKLYPCPICSSSWTALDIVRYDIIGNLMLVKCNNCDHTGGLGYTKEECVKHWNSQNEEGYYDIQTKLPTRNVST